MAALEKQYGAAYTKPTGKKMHTAGSVILSLGLTQAVLGVGFGSVTALSQDDVFRATSIGLFISGGITIAVGIPLMVKAKSGASITTNGCSSSPWRGRPASSLASSTWVAVVV